MIDLNTEELKNFLNDNPGASMDVQVMGDETRIILFATDEQGNLIFPVKSIYYLMTKT